MTLAELRAQLETRAVEADAQRSSAPLGDALRWVLGELAAVQGNGNGTTLPAPAKYLTTREAAARLSVTPRWLYRHADTLPFAHRLGAKTLRFDEAALERWASKR